MAFNTESLYKPLKTIKADLLKVIDGLDSLNSTAISFGGAIGNQLPVNVNSLIEKVEAILSSGTPDSVEGILEFLDNIPMGEIREKSPEERRAAGENLSRTKPVNLTPNLENGPQSAITQTRESLSLEDYYDKNYRKKPKKYYEDTDFSWDAILNRDDLDIDPIDFDGDDNIDGFDLSSLENEYAMDPDFSDENYADKPLNDYSIVSDDVDTNGQIEDESLSQSDWIKALEASDPISFGSLDKLAENIRDTGGSRSRINGKQSAKGINMADFHIE